MNGGGTLSVMGGATLQVGSAFLWMSYSWCAERMIRWNGSVLGLISQAMVVLVLWTGNRWIKKDVDYGVCVVEVISSKGAGGV
ncbi:hypothetical protein KMI_22g20100 [Encephalitozoon hellem]|nr:hypothetical protein KMI_22g20100 [Encephalitozoon hellem]